MCITHNQTQTDKNYSWKGLRIAWSEAIKAGMDVTRYISMHKFRLRHDGTIMLDGLIYQET